MQRAPVPVDTSTADWLYVYANAAAYPLVSCNVPFLTHTYNTQLLKLMPSSPPMFSSALPHL